MLNRHITLPVYERTNLLLARIIHEVSDAAADLRGWRPRDENPMNDAG